MAFTKVTIKTEYRDRLRKLAKQHNRSMANMIEVLIDSAYTQRQGLLDRMDELQHVSKHRKTGIVTSMQPYKDGVMAMTIDERLEQLTQQLKDLEKK